MPRKFKIGEIVGHTPPRGSSKRVEQGTFTIVGFLPEIKGRPMYRIRHDDTGTEHVVRESELYKP